MKSFRLSIGLAAILAAVSCSSPVAETPAPSGTSGITFVAGSHFTEAALADPVSTVAAGFTRYEAEDTAVATRAGSAKGANETGSMYSGSAAVGFDGSAPVLSTVPEDWSQNIGYVKFALPGLTAGTYTVRVGYIGPEAKIVLVRKDASSTTAQISMPASTFSEWDRQQYFDLNVPFDDGTNNLWISRPVKLDTDAADFSPWWNIDYIDIKKQ